MSGFVVGRRPGEFWEFCLNGGGGANAEGFAEGGASVGKGRELGAGECTEDDEDDDDDDEGGGKGFPFPGGGGGGRALGTAPGLPRCRGDRNGAGAAEAGAMAGLPMGDPPWWDNGREFPGGGGGGPKGRAFPKFGVGVEGWGEPTEPLEGGREIPGEMLGLSAGPSLGSGSCPDRIP